MLQTARRGEGVVNCSEIRWLAGRGVFPGGDREKDSFPCYLTSKQKKYYCLLEEGMSPKGGAYSKSFKGVQRERELPTALETDRGYLINLERETRETYYV
jgi:hypothetical protein